jgi:hypothetical protein
VDLDGLIGRLEASLRAVGSAERAASEQRYLKSDLRFIGVRLSDIRAGVKEIAAGQRDLDHDDLVALAERLWAEPVFEYLPAVTAARLMAAYREKRPSG